MLSELDAINRMLAAVRESPINSLNTAMPHHARMARNCLTLVRRDVLRQGWKFNTDVDVTLAVDGDGLITLGEDVLKVEFDRSKNSPTVMPVLRGLSVYDRKNQTTEFDDDLYASEVVRDLSWTSLPDTARYYISVRAARIFQAEMLGSNQLNQNASIGELEARREFQRDCGRESNPPNMLNSPGINELAFRRNSWL